MPSFESLPLRGTEPQPEKVPPSEVKEESSVTPESQEKIFKSVVFRSIYDGNGRFVGYKSSELGRKEIVPVNNNYSDLYEGDYYTVRVIKDTEPSDPNKGRYEVELLANTSFGPDYDDYGDFDDEDDSEDLPLKHKEAAKQKAERFRSSGGFRTLATMLNSDPDLSAEYRPIVGRHDEYRDLHESKEEAHRNFTGMISGLMMSERGSDLLNAVVDHAVERDSRQLKEAIVEDPYVIVPGVVVGSGVYGTVLALTRQMYLPDSPELTIEKEDHIGGQFAQYETDLFRLNSRRRPEMANAPHLPGTKQSLNSFGKFAAIQPSDVGNESYGYQSTISDPARVNFFLSGRAVTNSEIRKVRRDYDSFGGSRMVVEYLDKDTGKIQKVRTDRVVFATGIGKEESRLNEGDEVTKTILAEEAEKFEKGEDAQVLSFTEFARKMSDPENPFPMRGMKRVVLSGDGDSALVTAGILLGYESQVGKTAAQLDNVEEIIWVGSKHPTKEDFIAKNRARYIQVGLEFPREIFEGYYHRIKPVPDAKSYELERGKDGKIRVILRKKRVNDDESEERYVEGDHFIYSHGFSDITDDIVRSVFKERITSSLGIASALEAFRSRYTLSGGIGMDIYYAPGNDASRLEIMDYNIETDMVTFAITKPDNSYEELTQPRTELISRSNLFNRVTIACIERRPQRGYDDATENVIGEVNGKECPIARKYDGFEIYKAGPAAQMPLTQEEVAAAPALEYITENTAAIFRYVELVQALGTKLAEDDNRSGSYTSSLFSENEKKPVILPTLDRPGVKLSNFETVIKNEDTAKIGLEQSSLDLLKVAIGDKMFDYIFPANLSEINFAVTATTTGKETTAKVVVEPALPKEYLDLLEDLVQDSLFAGVLRKVVAKQSNRSQKMDISLPLFNGKIDAANASYSIGRIVPRG